MATVNTATQEWIDQRLDALDRALLGLLPRSERIALVLDVEARVQASLEANPSLLEENAAPLEELATAGVAARTDARSLSGSRRSRSGLARTAGVLGIVALASLIALPVTWMMAAYLAEAIDEVAAYAVLGLNFLLVAVGGTVAVVLGISALVRIGRSQGRQIGQGWAITALSTGSLPMLVGGLGMLTVVLPMVAAMASSGNPQPSPVYAQAVAPTLYGQPSLQPASYQPATVPPPGLQPATYPTPYQPPVACCPPPAPSPAATVAAVAPSMAPPQAAPSPATSEPTPPVAPPSPTAPPADEPGHIAPLAPNATTVPAVPSEPQP